MQQVDEEIQGTLMDAHLRVQRADLLVDLHAALSQSPPQTQVLINTYIYTVNQQPHGDTLSLNLLLIFM